MMEVLKVLVEAEVGLEARLVEKVKTFFLFLIQSLKNSDNLILLGP